MAMSDEGLFFKAASDAPIFFGLLVSLIGPGFTQMESVKFGTES